MTEQPGPQHETAAAKTAAESTAAESTAAKRAPARISRRKRWVFRILAATVVPLALLGLLEAGLRLAGFGYPTEFFQKSEIDGHAVLIENSKFGWRFFPKHLARAPLPTVLSREKAEGAIRVFVLGGSASKGEPEAAYGFSRILEVLLRERCPGASVEVVNVAMTAINSHVVRSIAEDCVDQEGDAWVVYMGNNEVVGPFAISPFAGDSVATARLVRTGIALKSMKVGQLLERALTSIGARSDAPDSWGGMEMFVEYQVRHDDERLETISRNFEANLGALVGLARSAGVGLVLGTVASNLRDCPPFTSLYRDDLSEADRTEWQQHFDSGCALEESGLHASALAAFSEAAKIDGTYAELPFRMGRCLEALGDYDAAREQFIRARDLDTLRFRTDSRLNDIVRKLDSERRSGLIVLDVEKEISEASEDGIPGEDFFHEHVHFTFDGNYEVARRFAQGVIDVTPELREHASGTWLTRDASAERLAYTRWSERAITDAMLRRLLKAPYDHQLNHETRERKLRERIAILDAEREQNGYASEEQVYRSALAARPSDWMLREQYAGFLASTENYDAARREWEAVVTAVPHNAAVLWKLGEVCRELQKPHDAEGFYRRAANVRPDFLHAVVGLGVALAEQGEDERALDQFREALELRQDYADAHVQLARSLAKLGRVEDADKHYRVVLDRSPQSFDANLGLGKLLASKKNWEDAEKHMAVAAAARPTDAGVHYHLGSVLSMRERVQPAIGEFLSATQLDPGNADYKFRAAVELTKRARFGDAERLLEAALRLRPSMDDARFLLGVVYLRGKRVDEAIRCFEATLKQNPNHPQAAEFLRQAKSHHAREDASRP